MYTHVSLFPPYKNAFLLQSSIFPQLSFPSHQKLEKKSTKLGELKRAPLKNLHAAIHTHTHLCMGSKV